MIAESSLFCLVGGARQDVCRGVMRCDVLGLMRSGCENNSSGAKTPSEASPARIVPIPAKENAFKSLEKLKQIHRACKLPTYVQMARYGPSELAR